MDAILRRGAKLIEKKAQKEEIEKLSKLINFAFEPVAMPPSVGGMPSYRVVSRTLGTECESGEAHRRRGVNDDEAPRGDETETGSEWRVGAARVRRRTTSCSSRVRRTRAHDALRSLSGMRRHPLMMVSFGEAADPPVAVPYLASGAPAPS